MTTHTGTGAVRPVRTCRYMVAYHGRCEAPADSSGFCRRHYGARCGVCGQQAVAECSHTGQFVCGTPLCDACEGFTDDARPNGSWGFANHGHRRKPVACEAEPPVTTQPDTPVVYVACPFCGEADFDRPGLKTHLLRGWCDGFNAVAEVTPTPDAPTADHPRGGGL